MLLSPVSQPRTPSDDTSLSMLVGGIRTTLTLAAARDRLTEYVQSERAGETTRLVKAVALGSYLIQLKEAIEKSVGYGYYEETVQRVGLATSTARARVRLAKAFADDTGAFSEAKYRQREAAWTKSTSVSGTEVPHPYLKRALQIAGLVGSRAASVVADDDADDDFDLDAAEAALERAFAPSDRTEYTPALAGATPPRESYASPTLSEANGPTASVRSDPRGYHHEAGEGRLHATAHLPARPAAAAPVNRDGGRRPIDYSTASGAAVQLTFESVYEEARRFGDEIAELLSKITTMPPDVARQVHDSISSLRALLASAADVEGGA